MEKSILIAITVFVVVSLAVFVIGSLLDQRSARARLLRERLASVQKAAEGQPSEEPALLRDEMLSKIPALDSLLRRSTLISSLQTLLSQADLKIRAGNLLLLCVLSGAALGLAVLFASSHLTNKSFLSFLFLGLGTFLGTVLPYSFASYRRTKRFQKFEALFPEAIDTLARAVRAGHAFTTALELIASHHDASDGIASHHRCLHADSEPKLYQSAVRGFKRAHTGRHRHHAADGYFVIRKIIQIRV